MQEDTHTHTHIPVVDGVVGVEENFSASSPVCILAGRREREKTKGWEDKIAYNGNGWEREYACEIYRHWLGHHYSY